MLWWVTIYCTVHRLEPRTLKAPRSSTHTASGLQTWNEELETNSPSCCHCRLTALACVLEMFPFGGTALSVVLQKLSRVICSNLVAEVYCRKLSHTHILNLIKIFRLVSTWKLKTSNLKASSPWNATKASSNMVAAIKTMVWHLRHY